MGLILDSSVVLLAERRRQSVPTLLAGVLAATALSIGFSVLTGNPRHFRMIPGLSVVPF